MAVGFMVEAGAEDIECSSLSAPILAVEYSLLGHRQKHHGGQSHIFAHRQTLASLAISYVKKSHAIIAASLPLSRYRQFLRDPSKFMPSVILPDSRTHIIHLVMLAGFFLSNTTNTSAYTTTTSVPNNEVTSSISE